MGGQALVLSHEGGSYLSVSSELHQTYDRIFIWLPTASEVPAAEGSCNIQLKRFDICMTPPKSQPTRTESSSEEYSGRVL